MTDRSDKDLPMEPGLVIDVGERPIPDTARVPDKVAVKSYEDTINIHVLDGPAARGYTGHREAPQQQELDLGVTPTSRGYGHNR
jgi:hypothetical protein